MVAFTTATTKRMISVAGACFALLLQGPLGGVSAVDVSDEDQLVAAIAPVRTALI
jgi:hypothetical protein